MRLRAKWQLNEHPLSLKEFSRALYENNRDFLEKLEGWLSGLRRPA